MAPKLTSIFLFENAPKGFDENDEKEDVGGDVHVDIIEPGAEHDIEEKADEEEENLLD